MCHPPPPFLSFFLQMTSLCSVPVVLWIVKTVAQHLHPVHGWVDWSEHEFITFFVAFVLCILLLQSTMSALYDIAMASVFCGTIRDKAMGKDSTESIGRSKFALVPDALFATAVFLVLSHMANLSYMTTVDDYFRHASSPFFSTALDAW